MASRSVIRSRKVKCEGSRQPVIVTGVLEDGTVAVGRCSVCKRTVAPSAARYLAPQHKRFGDRDHG